MSVTFDHSLVGTEMPDPPISNRQPNIRRILLKKMVNQIKAGQDFFCNLNDDEKLSAYCQAFIDALKLLKNWSTVGEERSKKFHEGQTWYEVTGRINYNRLQEVMVRKHIITSVNLPKNKYPKCSKYSQEEACLMKITKV